MLSLKNTIFKKLNRFENIKFKIYFVEKMWSFLSKTLKSVCYWFRFHTYINSEEFPTTEWSTFLLDTDTTGSLWEIIALNYEVVDGPVLSQETACMVRILTYNDSFKRAFSTDMH